MVTTNFSLHTLHKIFQVTHTHHCFQDDVRSALGSTLNFFFASGYLIEYIFGPHVSHRNLIYISCVAPVLFFLMIPLIPESPHYYMLKDDVKNAEKSLKRLRKGWLKKDIELELDLIKVNLYDTINCLDRSSTVIVQQIDIP